DRLQEPAVLGWAEVNCVDDLGKLAALVARSTLTSIAPEVRPVAFLGVHFVRDDDYLAALPASDMVDALEEMPQHDVVRRVRVRVPLELGRDVHPTEDQVGPRRSDDPERAVVDVDLLAHREMLPVALALEEFVSMQFRARREGRLRRVLVDEGV